MLAADVEPLLPNEVIFHLEKRFPTNWTAAETLVVRLAFNEDGNRMEFNLSDAEVFENCNTEAELKALLGQLAGGHPAPSGRRAPDPARQGALGVAVRHPTNVVVILDDREWRFRANGPAITAKANNPGDNFGSWHVDGQGALLENPQEDCRIACFLAAKRTRGNVVQAFNFHLALKQEDGRWLEVTIDPDVPETGSEGFPFTREGREDWSIIQD